VQSTVGIALLGCGTVGGGLAERVLHERGAITRRSGVDYALRGIAIRDPHKPRPHDIPPELFTRDAAALIDDPGVDLVVECIGGTEFAAAMVERALDRGRHVVTANKDLIATQGPRLRALAARRGVSLRYEAAVAGAVPVVRALEESLANEHVLAVTGIVNGTCNAILGAIERGSSYEAALADAQARGFAEADPSGDVHGTDAAHKLAVLVQIAFGLAVISPRIRRRGIDGVGAADVAAASRTGHRIKLLAHAVRTRTGCEAEVAPVWVRDDSPFARISGPDNAIRVLARDAGELFFSGPGAGRRPSASAVLADVVAALRGIAERHDHGARTRLHGAPEPAIEVAPAFAHTERVARFATLYEAIAAGRTLRLHDIPHDATAALSGTPIVRFTPRDDERSASCHPERSASCHPERSASCHPERSASCHPERSEAKSRDRIMHTLEAAGLIPASVYPVWNDKVPVVHRALAGAAS
jgi:homoserine dehydrogenase